MRNRQFGLQGSEGIPCDIRIGAPIDGWQPNPDIVRNRTNAGDPLRGDLGSSCLFRRSPGAAYDKPGQHREDADREGTQAAHDKKERHGDRAGATDHAANGSLRTKHIVLAHDDCRSAIGTSTRSGGGIDC